MAENASTLTSFVTKQRGFFPVISRGGQEQFPEALLKLRHLAQKYFNVLLM